MVAGSVMRWRMSSTSMANDSEPLGRQSSAAVASERRPVAPSIALRSEPCTPFTRTPKAPFSPNWRP